MKERPFNLHDVGILPELFCKECRVYIKPGIHRAEDGTSMGFFIRHPKNHCRLSEQQTVMPVVSLAQVIIK